MTGEIAPTEGNVIVGGKSIVSDQSEARKLIG
jgi:ABC-type multidrug transport system ATPase subunit